MLIISKKSVDWFIVVVYRKMIMKYCWSKITLITTHQTVRLGVQSFLI